MALLPKKTYSRQNHDLTLLSDKEKENVDPFDELLSSPLKQDVQFQPLSFWGKKVRRVESKQKFKKSDCGLFKASDSDEPISPCQRKRKAKAGKARTLQPKSRSQKLCDTRKNYSTANPCTSRTNLAEQNKNESMVSTNGNGKNEGWPLDNTLCPNESIMGTVSSHKSYNRHPSIKFSSHFCKAHSTYSYSVRSKLNESVDPTIQNNLTFKIYKDVSPSNQQLGKPNGGALIHSSKEGHESNFLDETISSCQLGDDSFKFVSLRKHFNYPYCIGGNDESFSESTEIKNNSIPFCDESKKFTSPIGWKFSTPTVFENNTFVNYDRSLVDSTLNGNENLDDETLCNENCVPDLSEELKESFKSKSSVSNVSIQTEFGNETSVYYNRSSVGGTLHGNECLDDEILHNEDSVPDLSEELRENCENENTVSNVSLQTEFDNETFDNYDGSSVGDTLNGSESLDDETICNENSVPDLSQELKEISMFSCQSKNNVSNVSMPTECDSETLVYFDNSLISCILNNHGMDKTLCYENSASNFGEESKDVSILGNTFSDFISLNDSELEVIIQELLNADAMDGVTLETSSTSDDTLSSFMDEETVINVRLKTERGDSPLTDSGTTKDISHSTSSGVSVLTSSMSELNIKNASGGGSPEQDNEKFDVPRSLNYADKKRNSFSVDLSNVTTKRRGVLHRKYERNVPDRLSVMFHKEIAETEFDQSMWTMGRPSMDWNKSISFANPVFESTRVFDAGPADKKRQTNRFENSESTLEESLAGFDRTYALKPGKKWLRSRSVLKQLQNGTIAEGRLESTRITGRKFESFVQEMLEIQNERSGFFTSLADITVSNKTVVGAAVQNTHLNANKTVLGCEDQAEKCNESVFCNETVVEKSSLNHTVKVIQQEEKPSAFRSALGLENNNSVLKEDSALDESSSISARDFILAQCGQEDVLPFEEDFNERTLENCRKIGEGVYGEVFMCSDTVIKIIPIEGADKVNGEPQKTFGEIISEVVIASKLSNLRRGKTQRTDGFSEMKRCWCVRGKYPKHLLKLWKEYDEQGSGSENDSPVMFKDDQLYIILELANGGKDLESFVFSSSAQSLSVFIQAAFSLAVAEKAFEFEHRDFHWGNVLISETKDKFMTVYLDGVEYKIPTKGVKVCIIDFTLSRINHEGCCIFNDLSVDPSLFASEGDYQFEIYRMMLKEVKNDWSLFRPRTNLFWLHYTLDKMLKMVRYKNKKAKVHIKHLKDLKSLECTVLEHKDSTDFVLGRPLSDVVGKL